MHFYVTNSPRRTQSCKKSFIIIIILRLFFRVAKNLPAPENFRRHWEVQKRHSGALAPLLETLLAGWLKCLNQEAPQFSQKAPKKAPKFFSPKSACILGKSTTDLTPQTIFIAFLCIKVFQLDIFLKIIYVIFETLFSFYLFCVK